MGTLITYLRNLKSNWRKHLATKQILQQVTVEGANQNIEPTASIILHFGAQKNNIILDDHSELFGRIIVWGNDSKVRIGKWAKIGFNCTINCVAGFVGW